MNKLLTAIAVGACLSFGVAHAAEPAHHNAQQTKMATCNKEAGDKKGDERKAFMKECLHHHDHAAAKKPLTPQQEKMKACHAEAKTKNLKGAPRKAFMKECLSNKPA
jgi:hypothetical protein